MRESRVRRGRGGARALPGVVLLAALLCFFFGFPGGSGPVVWAQTDSPEPHGNDDGSSPFFSNYLEQLRDSFTYIFKTLLYTTVAEPADSTLNPGNNFLEIPRYTGNIELRPDFSMEFWRIKSIVKPRLRLSWMRWEEGNLSGDSDTDEELYVNEWLVSLGVTRNLFVTYGRENLQWGPSYFITPSNPFFRDNGQSNPKVEVAGMDFARLVWVPSSSWTVSLIANTDRGRQEFPVIEFEPTYALKIDNTGYRRYYSFILSYQEENRASLGGFGGWTVTDALQLYGDFTISPGSRALYPVVLREGAFTTGDLSPIVMRPINEDDSSLEGVFLTGASYTFDYGGTVSLEYVHNSAGYSDEQAELYYAFRRQAAGLFELTGEDGVGVIPSDVIGGLTWPGYLREAAHDLSRLGLSRTFDTGLRLLRRNYLMVQYQQAQIHNKIDLVFRYTYNLDDDSSSFSPIVQWAVGDHSQLFLIGSKTFGSDETEYRSLLDYGLMLGVEYTF